MYQTVFSCTAFPKGSSMTDTSITLRLAQPADANMLAKLLLEAGEGLYEFIFSDLDPGRTARNILADIIASGKSPLGWQNFRVATMPNLDTKCDVVVGMINAFPCELTPQIVPDRVPADRISWLEPLLKHALDPQTLMLNAVAVKPTQRGLGIGLRLVAESVGMAGASRRKRIVARVWANNGRAVKLYGNFGFKRTGSVELPTNNRLSGRQSVFFERAV